MNEMAENLVKYFLVRSYPLTAGNPYTQEEEEVTSQKNIHLYFKETFFYLYVEK